MWRFRPPIEGNSESPCEIKFLNVSEIRKSATPVWINTKLG